MASVIIPAWRNPDSLQTVLRACGQLRTTFPFEVLVVHNGGDLIVKIAATTGGVPMTYIPLVANLGFGGGCNAGTRQAKGRYLVFLNDDAMPEPDWLQSLVDVAEADETTGAVGSQLRFPNGDLQEAGGRVRTDGHGEQIGIGTREPYDEEYLTPRSVAYCSGAALLVRADVFAQLGGFDKIYAPAYFEDVDLCLRVHLAGYDVRYEPTAVVVHAQHGSTQTEWRDHLWYTSFAAFEKRWGAAHRDAPIESHEDLISRKELVSLDDPAIEPASELEEMRHLLRVHEDFVTKILRRIDWLHRRIDDIQAAFDHERNVGDLVRRDLAEAKDELAKSKIREEGANLRVDQAENALADALESRDNALLRVSQLESLSLAAAVRRKVRL